MRNKIVIYDKNASPVNGGYLGHGFGLLKESSRCEITEELNGDYSLELDYPLDGNKASYIKKWNVIRADGQLFRIYKIEDSTEDNLRTAYARHISYDIANDIVFDERVVNGTLAEAIESSIPTYFKPHFTYSSDIEMTNNVYFVRKDGIKCLFDALNRWGVGELVRDNFHIAINWNKGIDTGAIFTAQKMEGIELTTDVEEVITRLLPVGYDGLMLPEKYVEIPNWSSEEYPPFHLTKEVSFEEVTDEGTLRELAMDYAQEAGFAAINMKISLSQIQGTTIYKHLYKWNQFNVGDVVTVKHPKLDDLRIKTKIIKRVIDCVTEECTLELGQPLSSLDDFFFNSVQKQLVNAQANIKSDLQYWQNADPLVIDCYSDRITSLSVSTKNEDSDISSIAFLTVTGFASVEGDELEVELFKNNTRLLMTPVVPLHAGLNTATFHWPSVGIGQNENHVFELVMRTKSGTFTVEKYQATFTVNGVGIVASGGKSEPRPFVFVEWKPGAYETKNGMKADAMVEIEIETAKPKQLDVEVSSDWTPPKYLSLLDSHTQVDLHYDKFDVGVIGGWTPQRYLSRTESIINVDI